MGVEVAGTEHVATAGFDVAGGHIKVRFCGFLLRRGVQVDEANGKRKYGNQEKTACHSHDPSMRNFRVRPYRNGREFSAAVHLRQYPKQDTQQHRLGRE
jgi:hypothetical protein